MATRQFTLSLTGLSDLVVSRVRQVVPAFTGQTAAEERSINGVVMSTSGSTQALNLTIDAAMTQAEFALFEEYLFEQERNDNRGNIIAKNEYTRVNARWSTINSRTQVAGSAQTTHGNITQYFVQHPALIIVASDFWEVAGENSQGQWRDVVFEIQELI